jgi:hypothetical protein
MSKKLADGTELSVETPQTTPLEQSEKALTSGAFY